MPKVRFRALVTFASSARRARAIVAIENLSSEPLQKMERMTENFLGSTQISAVVAR
ncbi:MULTISPECIES: hypothetical protein [Chroococcidiopsis]|jgi:hypothetical protein|uniref:hypothetical protein n=1 Tax=Chroococcidiopsis TaxID=54298 RepID=UPI000318DB7A|nr:MULTISPECIES: hypothetical protein [Chroococcidiopsis]MBE9017427.1 hypothetical protein [Chroococcidiopsidales cyanobacterium LEGE 13417]URD52976.1 hypothetical protein M5J74_13455 [Chroococcidiopsis sp. CCNUC1]